MESVNLPTQAGAMEIALLRVGAVKGFGQIPVGETGRIIPVQNGWQVDFAAGCVLHVEMTRDRGPLKIGRMEIRSCQVDEPFIIMLRLQLANRAQPYFLIPGVLYGTNNANREPTNTYVDDLGIGDTSGYGADPQLSYRAQEVRRDRRRSPCWHFRTDHSAAPMVSATFDGHFVALGIGEVSAHHQGAWTYNALGVWTDRHTGDAITATMGTLEWPARLINHQLGDRPQIEPLNPETAVGTSTEFFICYRSASSRFAYEPVLTAWYQHLRQTPRTGAPLHKAIRDVSGALVRDGIDPESGYFCMFRTPEGIAPIGTLLAWAGILQIARPLIRAGRILQEPHIVNAATRMVDLAVDKAYSPQSGLFNDMYFEGKWQPNIWWPSLGLTSLISGHACYLLLKMYEDDNTRQTWAGAARRVLAHVLRHQRQDGRFPSGFSPEDGRPVSYFGFGGCFWVAPLLLLHRLLDDTAARDAALKALDHYWQQFCQMEWNGVDLDCRGAQDSGSSYALIRALVELHRQSGDQQVLERLAHGLHYACSYRFGYNVHLRNPVCDWSSCGAKVTSTHNCHLDAYGGELLEELDYYQARTGDAYFRSRIEDSLAWARQAYNRTPDEYGWGKVGWATEQYYHTHDHYHHPEGDGTAWLAYFPWAAGALLNHYVLEATWT